MAEVLIVVDNSNIHVQTKESFGYGARFSYSSFEKQFHESDNFVAKQITGSTPPAQDTFWNRMRRDGYEVITYERKQKRYGGTTEKSVDTAIVARATEAIILLKPEILVLFSGDFDMRPLVEMAKKHSCVVHLWTYKESSSPDLEKECYKVFYIEDHKLDLIFYQICGGETETYAEFQERRELERQQHAEARRRELESEDDDGRYIPAWIKWVGGSAAVAAVVSIAIIIARK